MKRKSQPKLWTPAVRQYIVEHYMGTEESEKKAGVVRRVFMWEHDGKLLQGNLTAFTEHLCQYFGIPLRKWAFTTVDSVLVDAGLRVREFANRTTNGTGRGEVIPEPESHVVGKSPTARRLIAEFMVRVYSDGTREIVDAT